MKILESIVLTGIFLSSSFGFAEKSDAFPIFKNNLFELTKEYNEHKFEQQKKNLIGLLSINYKEWKIAVEKPKSKEAEVVKVKARIMCENGEEIVRVMDEKEKKDYENFWKHFSLDIEKIKPKTNNKEVKEAFFNYALLTIIELRSELEDIYNIQFNYISPSEGEKVLIFKHFNIYRTKFFAEGGKMPDYLHLENSSKTQNSKK